MNTLARCLLSPIVLAVMLSVAAFAEDEGNIGLDLGSALAPLVEDARRLHLAGDSDRALRKADEALARVRALENAEIAKVKPHLVQSFEAAGEARLAEVAAYLAPVFEAGGRTDELVALLERGWRAVRRLVPPDARNRAKIVATLKTLLMKSGRSIEAEFLAEAEWRDGFFDQHALSHLRYFMEAREHPQDENFDASFQAAQSMKSETAISISRMAIRRGADSMDERALLRERQDLFEDWRALSAGDDAVGARTSRGKASIRDRVAAIDEKIARIAPQVRATLGIHEPPNLAGVRAALAPDEALLMFSHVASGAGSEKLFLWLVTLETHGWWQVDLGDRALADRVDALRCGLDRAAWTGEGQARCNGLLGRPADADRPEAKEPLPFDPAGAHDLYARLFAPIQSAVAGKHLLVAPSGPLTRLPFNVLITEPPSPAGMETPRWLPMSHAVSVLPSVYALIALRGKSLPSGSDAQMLAFANPVLDGDEAGLDESELKKLRRARAAARYRQRCELPPSPEEVQIALAQELSAVFMGGGAASDVRSWTPVPSTASQVCEIAEAPGLAGASRVVLASEASERTLRQMNASGELERYRIIQFATHGALAGQVAGTSEPGLILTPPDVISSGDDDGFLSASEVADLKLNADWVILSACNTAAARTGSDEALSGLASAFFYADARALLVSHWEVYTTAAVKLIQGAIVPLRASRLGGDNYGRAEAVRRAMIDVIRTGNEFQRHPAYWAPFVLVGEGGAGR